SVNAPEGLLALVFGFDAGVALVDAPGIAAVGFTGSVPAGRALWARANARPTPIPFYGELGAANPLVVTQSAATQRGVEIGTGIAGSMTLGVGQFCTKPGLLFIPRGDDGDALVSALVSALEDTSPMTMLSVGIAKHFRSGSDTVKNSDTVVQLTSQASSVGTNVSAQLFEVTATEFVSPSNEALREECFGPLAIVIRFAGRDDLTSALESANAALTFSVFTSLNDEDASWLIDLGHTRAGRVIANGYPTGVGVSWSMQHGGPWPATTASFATSVGAAGIERWLRPIAYQSVSEEFLPEAVRDGNPLGFPQRVDGSAR
ncbi:MAG TPA: aldehyde dehydrogenase family protein, partial [Acidimicrobiales bacterium]